MSDLDTTGEDNICTPASRPFRPSSLTWGFLPQRLLVYAMYGLDKDHSARYPPLGFPAFIHPDGSPDEGVAVPLLDSDARKVAKYTWTLLLPESDTDSLGKYLDGEAILGVALYGIRGIKMGPVLASANATTFVS